MSSILEGLNLGQKSGVTNTEGPLMIIAGAGSGKTKVLTHRIAQILNQGTHPENIMALTFTNKASSEMKERIALLVGEDKARDLLMGTFHSVFARMLRRKAEVLGYSTSFTIYDTQDALALIGRIIKAMELDKEMYKPKRILSRVSQCKNNLITPSSYAKNVELTTQDKISNQVYFYQIYAEYVSRCHKQGAMDFDDLLLKMHQLLGVPDILHEYQNQYRYVLVDEYQDTNHSQYLIVKRLAGRYRNLCVVGDDAQSIYSFRGADISNILNFKKDYEDAQIVKLEQNYRSTKTIVNASNGLIDHNKDRIKKNLFTQNQNGDDINIYKSVKDTEEARFVVGSILDHRGNNDSYQDMAILYRTNAQSRVLEEALIRKDIPYRLYGGLSFYQRKEIKDLTAYLRLMVNPEDDEAFLRVINYPARGIGSTSVAKILALASDRGESCLESVHQIRSLEGNLNSGLIKKLETFSYLIKSAVALNAKSNPLQSVVEYIYKTSGMKQAIDREASEEHDLARKQNIEEFFGALGTFGFEQEEQGNTEVSLEDFLESITLLTAVEQKKSSEDEAVSLMTVHLSKGLEFDHVYMVGMEDGLFPSLQPVSTKEDIEEERRLCYVAMTRAKKKLWMSYNMERFRWGKLVMSDPSRFISEIPEGCLTYHRNYEKSSGSQPFTGMHNRRPLSRKPTATVPSEPSNRAKMGGANLSLEVRDRVMFQDREITRDTVVFHEKFGKGCVLKLQGEGKDSRAVIDFERAGQKNILLHFAKLKIL